MKGGEAVVTDEAFEQLVEKYQKLVYKMCIRDSYVTQPVWDKEAIIRAELELDRVPASRMEFDACGHYSRPDVLELRVHE